MITTGAALIRYVQDYDPLDTDYEVNTTQVNLPGGGRKYVKVAISDGSSTEFLIENTYEALEKLRTAFAAMGNAWTAADRFEWLEEHLRGAARQHCKNIVARNYRNQNQKTHNNYEELRRRVITALSDHVNPGNRVRTMLMQEIHYFRCKMTDGSGKVEKPTRVLVRLERIREIAGTYMHHSQGDTFLSTNDFKNSFWNIFPKSMKNWLTNDQDIDPFDATNPLDVEEIADQMQRWYNIPGNIKEPGEANKNKRSKGEDESNDGNDQGRHKRGKKNGDQQGRRGNNKSHGGGHKSNCKIAGHEKYRHNWFNCFLNPRCRENFDPEAAKKFYENEAHGENSFYRDIYEAYQNRSGNTYGGGGRGAGTHHGGRGGGGGRGHYQGGGGRGRGNGGRGYQGRGGGGRGGGYNQYPPHQGHGQQQQGGYQPNYQYDEPRWEPYQQQGNAAEGYSYQGAPPAPQARRAPTAPPTSAYAYPPARTNNYGGPTGRSPY